MTITDFNAWLDLIEIDDHPDDIDSLLRGVSDRTNYGLFSVTPRGDQTIVQADGIEDDLLLGSELARETFIRFIRRRYTGDTTLTLEGDLHQRIENAKD